MSIAAIELLATIAMYFVSWVIKKMKSSEDQQKAYEIFGELARTMNLKTITARLDAEKQLKAASDKWDEVERQEKANLKQ